MMIKLEDIIHQLTVNAEGICALAGTISDEQATWKPTPETWCMKDVMEHFYNEERIDFRMHLQEMLSDPPQAWGSAQHEGYISVESFKEAIERFLRERESSMLWLKDLNTIDGDIKTSAKFGPDETITLSTGDVLYSWVAHDFLHIRQINELLYAWCEKQASPHSLQYAGGW